MGLNTKTTFQYNLIIIDQLHLDLMFYAGVLIEIYLVFPATLSEKLTAIADRLVSYY